MSWLKDTTQDYRRGYVEGESAERDAYRLLSGATYLTEYERGFFDGMKSRENDNAARSGENEDAP